MIKAVTILMENRNWKTAMYHIFFYFLNINVYLKPRNYSVLQPACVRVLFLDIDNGRVSEVRVRASFVCP